MKKEKRIFPGVLLVAMVSLACVLLSGCSDEGNCTIHYGPYGANDGDGYTVSVKYDANGGLFNRKDNNMPTTSSVIVDSYNAEQYKSAEGDSASIALLPTDASERGKDNSFIPEKKGYFFAGWYEKRSENGKDKDGNLVYTYADKWDFEKDRLVVDTKEKHTSKEPVMTLYAAWIPLFEVEIYDLDSGEKMGEYSVDPMAEIEIPSWDIDTGKMDMQDFPEKEGYTFESVYYDAEGNEKIDAETIIHTGTFNEEDASFENNVMKLYVDWTEGKWYHIHTAKQLAENASLTGSYLICDDLDFTGVAWPSNLSTKAFKGTIEGEGHTISNVNVVQSNTNDINVGLFGQLSEDCSIKNVKFDNVTFTVKKGTRTKDASFGLFAGRVSDGAEISEVTITNSKILFDKSLETTVTENVVIGVICGIGSVDIDDSDITVSIDSESPVDFTVTVQDGMIELHYAEDGI